MANIVFDDDPCADPERIKDELEWGKPKDRVVEETISSYHIVFRPSLDLLPEWGEMIEYVRNINYLTDFCVSAEKGKSKGMEQFNHYDIVISVHEDRRTDSIKRSMCDALRVPKGKRKNIKCFRIDEKHGLLYQLGYCVKEGIRSESTYGSDIMLEASALYEKTGPLGNPENFKEDYWSVDDFAIHFREWLIEVKDNNNNICESVARSYFKVFMRLNRSRLKFSVYQKVNLDRMCEYVSDMD